MDDTDDDARYPPNPRRHQFSSFHHRPFKSRPPQPDSDDSDGDLPPTDEDSVEDDNDRPPVSNRRIPDGDDGGNSSSESRGKRRRLDKLALGFEFAPRGKALPPRTSADWSEDSTFVLLDAWGDLFVQNGRKSLRSDEWSEVAKKVSQSSRTPRSDAQCRNRVDTLKKKYKKEKVRMAGTVNPTSDWVYFDKMDTLMSSPPPLMTERTPSLQQHQQQVPRLPCGVDAGEYVFGGSNARVNRANGQAEVRDSPVGSMSDDDDDESDGLPPVALKHTKGAGGFGSSSFRLLADSIQKFGDIYEKMESNKRQQLVELERMRKEFQRDLEVQKRQILERAQAEIARICREEDEEDDEEAENENAQGNGGEEVDGM